MNKENNIKIVISILYVLKDKIFIKNLFNYELFSFIYAQHSDCYIFTLKWKNRK